MFQTRIEPRVLPFRRPCATIDSGDLAVLLADHAEVRRACRELEAFADRLSERPSASERHAVADLIEAASRKHLEVTSRFLDRTFAGERVALGPGVLARILLRQIADSIHAEDVVEALRSRDLHAARIDMLGYMLRCLFDGYRRALDTEELALLLLARERLTPAARRALERSQERAADLD